jgi:hypothetical protein
MSLDHFFQFVPDLIFIFVGFGLRHFLPFLSSLKKEKCDLDSKQKELDMKLAQVDVWLNLHAQSCPYVKKKFLTPNETLSI